MNIIEESPAEQIENLERTVKVMRYLLRREEAYNQFYKANLSTLKGCRDMLREAAKQFRCFDDKGHAVMCDRHADQADIAIKNIE